MSLKAINIEILKEEGIENPGPVYDKIAAAGGFGSFPANYRPTLDIGGLSEDAQAQIGQIIANAKPEKPGKVK